MLRKLGFVVVALGLTLPAWASGGQPGSISGYVRNASGVPQMGAVVEVLGSAVPTLRFFTDEKGFYSAGGLLPGVYSIKVSALSFLPALRERVGLHPGSRLTVNVTLSTLFDAIQLGPVRGPADEDDWKWVLRSVASRPVLRILEDGSAVTVNASESEKDEHDLKAKLAFFAGSSSAGFGEVADVSTGFSLEKSLFATGTVTVSGNVGYGETSPAAVLRASYSHTLGNGSQPSVAFTMRRLPSPIADSRGSDLQALALTTADDFTVGDILELHFGSELQTIQFLGRVTAFRPFGSADLHLSPNTVVGYQYATSLPDTRMEKGFDSAPADLSESNPRVSIMHFAPALERAYHQEISVSRRIGKNNVQLALYSDRVASPALTGVGETTAEDGDVLASLYSGTFTYQGRNLDARGLRLVLQRKLLADLTATLNYDFGGVLALDTDAPLLQEGRQAMVMRNRHSLATKVSGRLPRTRTQWVASYRWIDGQALTPVDMFNASPGQADPYVSFLLRQPIPWTSFLPAHMDAMVDVRNLLAQGYVPLIGQDGRTVYLVQSARSVRGGVAFTF